LGSSASIPATADREEWEGTDPEDKRRLKIRYRVRAMSLDLIGKNKGGSAGSPSLEPAPSARGASFLELKSVDIARYFFSVPFCHHFLLI
jgi:hypothetical protein